MLAPPGGGVCKFPFVASREEEDRWCHTLRASRPDGSLAGDAGRAQAPRAMEKARTAEIFIVALIPILPDLWRAGGAQISAMNFEFCVEVEPATRYCHQGFEYQDNYNFARPCAGVTSIF